MAEVAAVPATPKTKKSVAKPKKSGTKKPAASHPTYSAMITAAVKTLKDRKGSSRQAIVKYIVANYKVEEKAAVVHVRRALKSGVISKSLIQAKGTGASGRFKLPESAKASSSKRKTAKKTPKKAAKTKKSPKKTKKVKTPKKPAAKKATKPKKPAAKKATKSKK